MPHFKGYYCFCSHLQSLVELESVIVATAQNFETLPLLLILYISFLISSLKLILFDPPS
jgi:hypothetical protein